VLVQQEVVDGIELLSARGPITPRDAAHLRAAVDTALAVEPRAVVLDLTAVTSLSAEAQEQLGAVARDGRGWPRPAVLVCAAPDASWSLHGVPVMRDRAEALRHVDDRPTRRRERVPVEHSAAGPAQARAAVRRCSSSLGVDDVSDDLALLVSEMVTNAVRHAAPPVSLEVEVDEADVVVAVHDGSPSRPRARVAGDEDEDGRGMVLVDLLSAEHGVRPEPPGKAVWVRLRRHLPPRVLAGGR
jgi:anti-sigma regulatory factor (Ser/Thr protein kinase)